MWSYRWARMRYNLKKRKRMDLSLIPKFQRGTFVNFVGRYDTLPMEVLGTKDNGGDRIVSCYIRGTEWQFLESDLRTLVFREFAWFMHPRTGKWMSGKTRGWMAVLIHLFTLILCAGIATTHGWWGLCPIVIPAAYWYYTWRNFKGLTV